MTDADPWRIETVAALEELYGEPPRSSLVKETDHLHPFYRPFVEAATFVALATAGPTGLDVSPRGDPAGFVEILDERTLLLPDRRGNNRMDSLRNLLADPRVALLFLVPGAGETLRVNGRATLSVDPALLARFEMQGQRPKSVMRIAVESVYFQCSRAIVRARLWDPAQHVDRAALPSAGRILAELSQAEIDGEAYDRALPERVKATLY